MEISKPLSDQAILSELGERISRRRIDLSITQAALAEQAGVSKRTVERIESGASAQMSSLIRLFRVLDLLPALDKLIPEVAASPMELLKHKGKTRQRASSVKTAEHTEQTWSWNEDA